MRVLSGLLPAICICLAGQAFAEPPQAEHPQPTPQAQAAEAATPPSTATTSAPSGPANADKSSSSAATTSPAATALSDTKAPNRVVLTDKTLTDAQVKELLSQGYRPQASADGVVYCRREAVMNSRFERKICKSADAIALEKRDSKEMTEHIQRSLMSPAAQ